MSNVAFARWMARYNAWQNDNLVGAASGLSSAARRLDRGAFFGSIEGTFAHLLWADRMWMSRLAPARCARPEVRPGRGATLDWEPFVAARRALDGIVTEWADGSTDADLARPLTWTSGLAGRELTRDRALVVTHFFNHQTHHRGQIHAMLTAAGATPSDTDLLWMPLDPGAPPDA